MTDTVSIGFDKENFESYIDEGLEVVLSTEQWEKVCSEIQGRLENFLEELVSTLVEDYNEGVGVFDEEEN